MFYMAKAVLQAKDESGSEEKSGIQRRAQRPEGIMKPPHLEEDCIFEDKTLTFFFS